MKKLSAIILFSVIVLVAPAVFAQQKWATYQNARYGYTVDYPSDLLQPQGEADNGDGQIFSNDAAEMRVYGSQMLLHKTLRSEFNALLKEHAQVSYKLFHRNYFVISGTDGEEIFYQKTMARDDGTFTTFYIKYPIKKRADYDSVTAKIVKSFK